MAVNQGFNFMLIWVPLGKSREESPDLNIFRMEYMRAVSMYIDRVLVKIVETVSSDMVSSVYEINSFATLCKQSA